MYILKKEATLKLIHIGRKAPQGYKELAGGIHLGKGIWILPIEKVKLTAWDKLPKKEQKALKDKAKSLVKCLIFALCIGYLSIAQAQEIPAPTIDVNRLANAIYKAENSKSHPYGILAHYKHTSPRQACINSIKSALKHYAKQSKEKDFILFLSKRYAPIGAKNDPKGLNKNWVRLVKHFYNKEI